MSATLLVMAAGMGSRYGGLKQIDPVGPNGETIIDYSIHDAKKAGFDKVVFIIRHAIEEEFKNFIGSRFEGVIDVEYAFQEIDKLPNGYSVPEGREKPWGTGHAILMAKDLIDAPFLVINGDDFYGQNAFTQAAKYLNKAKDGSKADYCMVGYDLINTLSEHGTVSRGICEVDGKGNLVNVVETLKITEENDQIIDHDTQKNLNKDAIASMNMFGFTPSLFGYLEEKFKTFLNERISEEKSEYFIPQVVKELIDEEMAEVNVLRTSSKWFGITYKEDKPLVSKAVSNLVNEGVYPQKLYS
jgi:NDP-sugar pyrophosphorylase family protein